ncbi:cupin domain-containing protein [Xinfangfangia sp. CPCC 101601]|uniref:Cupin domain-containing protein n=1 Tax=Pseudogemmobacter lacusdianii TaxID=3069608 RepID=A0ABU0W0W1_9RHOB|nr:cupin domain-containing protein [Xinfangfangia sp. CPCC 101601]MDQ2067604.1 cupin domain-containing protein [Xinfangfangia sp. CPCC 101601]
MTDVKLFRKADQDLVVRANGAAVQGLVNTSFSSRIGAGIGVFENCRMEWTVTYDEVLFILEGEFTLRTKQGVFKAGPGDTLWIPEGTWLIYEADAPVTFFYSVAPVTGSPTTGIAQSHPTAPADSSAA